MSGLTRFSLRNRALIALITVFVFLGGIFAAGSLRQELIPSLELPVVAVITPVPGSGAEVIEEQVTRPLESAVLAVPNVTSVESSSGSNVSAVTITLEYGTDIPDTQARIQRAVLAVPDLPEGADPTVITGSIDDFPVMQVAVSGDLEPDELADRLNSQIVPELEDVSGVRSATATGTGVQNITVALDEAAMENAGLTASAVANILTTQGVVVPGGTVQEGQTELDVQVGNKITSLDELRDLPVSDAAGAGALGGVAAMPGRGGGGMAAPGAPVVPTPTPTATTPGTGTPTGTATPTPPGTATATPTTSEAQTAPTAPTGTATPTSPATTTSEAQPAPSAPTGTGTPMTTENSEAQTAPTGTGTATGTATPTPSPTQSAPTETSEAQPAPTGAGTGSPTPTSPPATGAATPTGLPTDLPTGLPTDLPTGLPTDLPTGLPTDLPTGLPTDLPTGLPTDLPTGLPTDLPTGLPTDLPTGQLPPGGIPQLPPGGVPGEVPQLPDGQVPPGGLPQVPPGGVPQLPPGGIPQVPQIPSVPSPTAPSVTRLGDVAEVSFTPSDEVSIARANGRASVALSVVKVPGASTVDISRAVNERLPELQELIPGGQMTVVFDQAPFIEQSISDLTHEGALGLVMAVLVVFAFLLSLRLTLVTAVSIPASLLVALIGLLVTDNTLNILTLSALTISIGRVVDDSIVVVENIKQKLDAGLGRFDSVLQGVREVAGAITASTIVTVAVFLPIGLVGGQAGELFRPFAVTVGLAMGASLLVALTIVPVLAYWFVKPRPQTALQTTPTADPGTHTGSTAVLPRVGEEAAPPTTAHDGPRGWLDRLYLPSLLWALKRPVITMGIAVLALVLAGVGATQLKTEFIGATGGNSVQMTQTMPPGTAPEATDEAAQQVEAVLGDIPGVETYLVTIGGGGLSFGGDAGGDSATYSISLAEGTDSEAITEQIRSRTAELEGVGEISIGGGGFGGDDVQIRIQGPDDATLRAASDQVAEAMRGVEGAGEVGNDLADQVPTLSVDVDRAKALANGVTEAGVGQAVSAAVQGRQLGTVEIGATSHDVVLNAGAPPETAEEIGAVVAGANYEGDEVLVRQVASVEREQAPAAINRVDGNRAVTVSVEPAGDDLGALTGRIEAALAGLTLPSGATADIGGVAADQAEAFDQLGLATLAAIAITYVVMVATFGSLVQPFMLLISIPFAGIGAVVALLITDTPLGVASFVGILMLVGIVVTNAIVLIDRVNQHRAAGLGVRDAVILGARNRLRPIVMTALATILALTPMALSLTGGGAFISQPLALVVIGGLLSSTLLTLLIVPVLYVLLERVLMRVRRRREDEPKPADPADSADVVDAPRA